MLKVIGLRLFLKDGGMGAILVEDPVGLLVGERAERFPYEREIRLFQLYVWSFAPDQPSIQYAGLAAAVKILEFIEEEIYSDKVEEFSSKTGISKNMSLNDTPP